jgi:diguanylate cyclase (GGDEF)-like protein
MALEGPSESKGVRGRIDAALRDLFDWFTGLPREEAIDFRSDILETVMLKPSALLLTGMGVLLMSGTVMALTGAGWAITWFAVDSLLLALRLIPTFLHERRGRQMPAPLARMVVMSALIMCLIFGAGCSATVLMQTKPLMVVATGSLIGVVAGLATRWAALPRLALPAIVVIAVPFCAAVATAGNGMFRAGAMQFAVIIAATAALTLQNNRTLVALFRAERRNRVLATTDSLTGLPNRAGLIAELNRLRTAATDGQDGEITSLFVDLDSFKAVNDRFGHSAGDRVLAAAAMRLRAVAAPHFVCRLGGDEFVVVMNSSDRAVATFVARHIAERIREPIEGCAAEPVLIGASIGVAFGSIANRDAEQILAEADMALYLAKDAGGGRHAIGSGLRVSA